jgi:hypothetical protein
MISRGAFNKIKMKLLGKKITLTRDLNDVTKISLWVEMDENEN